MSRAAYCIRGSTQETSRKRICKTMKMNGPGRYKLGQGRYSWHCAKRALMYSDLFQTSKWEHLSVSSGFSTEGDLNFCVSSISLLVSKGLETLLFLFFSGHYEGYVLIFWKQLCWRYILLLSFTVIGSFWAMPIVPAMPKRYDCRPARQ